MICQNPNCIKIECLHDIPNNTWTCPDCGWRWQLATYEDKFFWAWEDYYNGMDGDGNDEL